MTSISNDSLTIVASGNRYVIPFDPPMKSLHEARDRVVAMDAEATKALNRSDITIKEYVPPNAIQSVILGGVLLGFFAFLYAAQFQPGHVIYGLFWRHLPGLAALVHRNAALALVAMVVIHGGEAIAIHYTKLKKHSVPVGSTLWYKWIVSTFFEGISCFIR